MTDYSQGQKINLAITLGDLAGIGAEIILKALCQNSLVDSAHITLIGSRSCLDSIYDDLKNISNVRDIWKIKKSSRNTLLR